MDRFELECDRVVGGDRFDTSCGGVSVVWDEFWTFCTFWDRFCIFCLFCDKFCKFWIISRDSSFGTQVDRCGKNDIPLPSSICSSSGYILLSKIGKKSKLKKFITFSTCLKVEFVPNKNEANHEVHCCCFCFLTPIKNGGAVIGGEERRERCEFGCERQMKR